MWKEFICIFLSLILFCSCSSKSRNICKSNNKATTLTSEFITSNLLKVDKEDFIKIDHIQSINLNSKQYKLNEVDILNNRKLISCNMLRDYLILETYSESNRNKMEIGLLNIKLNEYFIPIMFNIAVFEL